MLGRAWNNVNALFRFAFMRPSLQSDIFNIFVKRPINNHANCVPIVRMLHTNTLSTYRTKQITQHLHFVVFLTGTCDSFCRPLCKPKRQVLSCTCLSVIGSSVLWSGNLNNSWAELLVLQDVVSNITFRVRAINVLNKHFTHTEFVKFTVVLFVTDLVYDQWRWLQENP